METPRGQSVPDALILTDTVYFEKYLVKREKAKLHYILTTHAMETNRTDPGNACTIIMQKAERHVIKAFHRHSFEDLVKNIYLLQIIKVIAL